MNGIIHYFAYGSNMDEEQMKGRGVAYLERLYATLEGYALRFNKLSLKYDRTGVANIVPDLHSNTEGVLYTLYEDDLSKLDEYEGYPKQYTREALLVTLESGQKYTAFVYVAHPEQIQEGLKPSAVYLRHLLVGRDLLSADYIAELEKVETA